MAAKVVVKYIAVKGGATLSALVSTALQEVIAANPGSSINKTQLVPKANNDYMLVVGLDFIVPIVPGSIPASSISYIPAAMLTDTDVQGALDQADHLFSLLAPAKPDNLSTKTLTISGVYTAKQETTGVTHTTVINDTTPTAGTTNFFDGDSGTLTAEVDAAVTGSRALTTADDTGVYGDLNITADEDPYIGIVGKEGFWKQLDANITPAAPIALGVHTLQLKHSVTGDTPVYTVYIDDPATPVISGESITLPAPGARVVSGVPSMAVADVIIGEFTLDDAVSEYYNATRVAAVTSSQTTTQNMNPAAPPAKGATLTFTSGGGNAANCPITASAYSENVTIAFQGYSSGDIYASAIASVATGARVDTVSNETSRLIAGSGLYPAAGYGGAFDSTQSLKTVYTEELQLLNGKYQVPTGNYSANLPVAGEDYSSGMGAGDRYVIFDAATLTNNVGFTINILGSEGTWSGTITTGVTIHAKVEGVTGWLDCNLDYPGAGTPAADGDAAMLFGSSSALQKVINLSVARSGQLYVRIGLPVGSNKKFSGISITNLV